MATSIKRPRPVSCLHKGDFVLFYTSVQRPGRFKVGRFEPDGGKRMKMWNAVKTISAVFQVIKTKSKVF